jgi:hypothetical protein
MFSATLTLYLTSVSATESWCARVKPTPDGFVSLRAGPGTEYPVLMQIPSYNPLSVSTAQCSQYTDERMQSSWNVCDESGKWVFVDSVENVSNESVVQGWIKGSYVQSITCPGED